MLRKFKVLADIVADSLPIIVIPNSFFRSFTCAEQATAQSLEWSEAGTLGSRANENEEPAKRATNVAIAKT
jgi:hypothetical protein